MNISVDILVITISNGDLIIVVKKFSLLEAKLSSLISLVVTNNAHISVNTVG